MSLLYIVVLAVIAAALLAVAVHRTLLVKTKADYLVAGRSLSAWVLVLTLLTSWIGAGSLFAGAENAYRNGFAALWLPAGGWLGLVLIYFIAPRARKFAQFTLPDLLEARYNQTARVLGTIAILFAYVAITSYQFKGGGNVLHLIFPGALTPEQGTWIIAIFVIVTTAMAGMSSVAYMDVAIGSLVTVICIVATPMLLVKAGGWSGLHAALPAAHFRFSATSLSERAAGAGRAFEFFLPTMLLMLGNQSMYQKFFSAQIRERCTRVGCGLDSGHVVLETLIVAIAVFGAALFARLARWPPSRARYSLHGAARAAGFDGRAAYGCGLCQGDIDGVQLSVLARHQSGGRRLHALHPGRREQADPGGVPSGVVLLGSWRCSRLSIAASILAKMLYAYTIYSAAMTPVVLAAFYSKRATAWGAVAAIASGTAVTLAWDAGRGERDASPAGHPRARGMRFFRRCLSPSSH